MPPADADHTWIDRADLPGIENKYGLPSGILDAIAHTESNYNENARGPETRYGRAQGAFQFMPGTAKQYGLTNPNDGVAAAEAAGKYLRDLYTRYDGDVDKTIAAYNWGHVGVDRHGVDPSKMPRETRNYLAAVKKRLASTEA